jgi:hypothetical protein
MLSNIISIYNIICSKIRFTWQKKHQTSNSKQSNHSSIFAAINPCGAVAKTTALAWERPVAGDDRTPRYRQVASCCLMLPLPNIDTPRSLAANPF